MRFVCVFCTATKTQSVFPNTPMSAQQRIMQGIMVCNDHVTTAKNKLQEQGIYQVEAN